jgi:hypothetical protein
LVLLTAHLCAGCRSLVADLLLSVSSDRLQIAGSACHWFLLINPAGQHHNIIDGFQRLNRVYLEMISYFSERGN